MIELLQIGYNHQDICSQNCQNSKCTEYLLPEYPNPFIFHLLQKESSKWIKGRFSAKAIINVLIILVCFEPKFVCIRKEQDDEQHKDQDKSERRMNESHCEGRNSLEPAWITNCAIAKIMVTHALPVLLHLLV